MKNCCFFVLEENYRMFHFFNKSITLFLSVLVVTIANAGSPIETAKKIGDRIIRDTSFKNQLTLNSFSNKFDGIRFIDFERTFGKSINKTAFAFTSLTSDREQSLPIQLGFSGKCQIYLNDSIIFKRDSNSKLTLFYDERNVDLDNQILLNLRKGENRLLIELTGSPEGWIFAIQPEPDKINVGKEKVFQVTIGLNNVAGINKSVSDLTQWLLCGPFETLKNFNVSDIILENIGNWGYMISDGSGKFITWTIPHIEIMADVIDAAEWGTPYNWNYHNGGTAWAMQKLGELTHESKYHNYADNFCNYHLNNLPLIKYQVEELKMLECTNHHIFKTPLLDFTLAPSLPFIYKLTTEKKDKVTEEWREWVDDMLAYSKIQLRLPDHSSYTRTSPEKYTTWVDDMFMGIPFLVQAYILTKNEEYIDDAVAQVKDFNDIVWDKDANLYMHAQYSGRDCKMPHWSRANGWGLWAITEILTNLPEEDSRFKPLLDHYKNHIAEIIKYQSPSGLWYNVLEYPESHEEVSGSAIFTMAIAKGITKNWIDKETYMPILKKAWKGLQSKIDEDGSVRDICYGTMCSEDVNYYINRPFYTNDTHGLFAVIFACLELDNIIKE